MPTVLEMGDHSTLNENVKMNSFIFFNTNYSGNGGSFYIELECESKPLTL